jgi:hypothetical protein
LIAAIGFRPISSVAFSFPFLASVHRQSRLAKIGNDFVLPAQRTAVLRTGIAIANVCPYATPAVTIMLRDTNGLPVGTATVQLPANGHLSKFVDELISTAGTCGWRIPQVS